MENDLNFLKMEDNLFFFEKQTNEMKSKSLKVKTLIFLKMEDNLNFLKMEDNLNIVENGRQPRYF